jgi:hypothetical protein
MYTCIVEHALPAECVETLPKDDPVPRLNLQEADHTLERLRIGNDVQILQLLVGVQPTAGGGGGPRRGDYWYRPGGGSSRHHCSAQLRRPLCGTGQAAGPLKRIAQRARGTLPAALGGAVRNSGFRRVLVLPCCCCRRNSANFQVFVVVLPFAVLLWGLCCRIRRFCRSSRRRLCFRGFFLVGVAALLVVCIDLCLSVIVVV